MTFYTSILHITFKNITTIPQSYHKNLVIITVIYKLKSYKMKCFLVTSY